LELAANSVCGIYGYHITKSIELSHNMKIMPRSENFEEVNEWAKNPNSYQLTAVLTGAEITTDLLFNLEAILSFIDHFDVLITSPEIQTNNDPFTQFQKSIMIRRKGKGGKETIRADNFYPTSRSSFILNALNRLQNQSLENDNRTSIQVPPFNALLFKCVESFRQPNTFSDISYFLLFSGLESYARNWAGSKDLAAAEVIYQFLTKDDNKFNVSRNLNPYENDADKARGIKFDYHRSLPVYAANRNALFHNNEFTADINVNGLMINANFFEYLPHLLILVQLVILNEVGFDEDDICYKRWIHLQ